MVAESNSDGIRFIQIFGSSADAVSYTHLDAALGAYLNEGGFERGLFKVGLHHISNLQTIGNWRFRFYNDRCV